jgi:oligopeptide/dipeptide ABC transporter ATP-binding protein
MSTPLLEIVNLEKKFEVNRGGIFQSKTAYVQAVDNVSLELFEGETLGLVGESGCGKSTLARLILRLLEPTAGNIFFDGHDITNLKGRRLGKVRSQIQMIFQDPYSSLNPRKTVKQILRSPLDIHKTLSRKERDMRVDELLEQVGLNRAYLKYYPHQFSGGMRQRVGIARAIALKPRLLVADEPVSALDVSIQVQILNLLRDLQDQLGLTILFIAHDVSVVQYMSNRIALMYLGQLVELADREKIYSSPRHPYAQALMSAVPVLDQERAHKRIILEGDVPNPMDPPSGCRFHTRCWISEAKCKTIVPEWRSVAKDHYVACHLTEPDN